MGKGDRTAVDRVLSQTAYLRRSSPLFFMPLEPYPARSARHLPLEGKALSVDIVFSTYAYIRSDDMGIAVLSYNGAHETIFPLFFIPLSPSNLRPFGAPPSIGRREYPREPLPLEVHCRAQRGGVGFLFAAKPPPLCLPHRGRLCPLILFFSTYACICSDNARKAMLSYRSLPHWGRGTAQRWIGCSRKRRTCDDLPRSFSYR